MLELKLTEDAAGAILVELDITQCQEISAQPFLNALQAFINKAQTLVNYEAQKQLVTQKEAPIMLNGEDFKNQVSWAFLSEELYQTLKAKGERTSDENSF